MVSDNMCGDFVKQTGLHPVDPVKDHLGESRARILKSDRGDATGSRIDAALTSEPGRVAALAFLLPD